MTPVRQPTPDPSQEGNCTRARRDSVPLLGGVRGGSAFTPEQKEYLDGFMAGIAQRGLLPYVGETNGGYLTGDPAQGGPNLATLATEKQIHGFPISEVTKQELWKDAENPLDSWDRLLEHAEANTFPNEEDTFRFRYFGMFYVAPAQNSFMLRCRIPAGELSAAQLKGLADLAEEFGNGKAAITTRSNLQIREIAPKNLLNVLTRLQGLGLTAKGSGVDNVRNITASPTAGFDSRELLDTRPFAHALHHYILNHRDLYGLPRKFNVAFEGGGAVDNVANTNDIGFMAVKVGQASSLSRSAGFQPADATAGESPSQAGSPAYFTGWKPVLPRVADEKKPDENKKEVDKDNKDDQSAEKKDDKKESKKPKPVEIDLDDFEQRVVILPPKGRRYADLVAVPGKLIYRRLPRVGSGEERSPLMFYDLEKRDEKTILDDVNGVELSADRNKLLVRQNQVYAIVEPKEGQKLDKRIDTGGFESNVDPVAEWRQLFTDAWRFERDYFYDPGLHGVDWKMMRERYGKLLGDAVTRWDVSYVIGELIAELNSSHTYRSGGDLERSAERPVGYLGCDFVLTNGAYRIAKIIDGAPWDSEVRSPLLQPGVTNAQEGDYLLAVNGEPLDTREDPWAAFQGLADKPVFLTVNSNATRNGAHEVLVQTLSSEARLRNLAWIDGNRRKVEKLSDGKIGYVYVPDTGQNGQNELVRQWRGQVTKAGLIIDERFNSGGQIPDRFIELLDRPLRNYWGVRDGKDWSWPPVAHYGPKAMLINGWSGSGGDCFPFYFKQSGLGPLVGQRTWGGLIGITGTPPLMDGGSVTVPTFGIYDMKGEWIIESYGVDPDVEVVDDPGEMAKGGDPQLERAVFEVQKAIRQNQRPEVKKPKYPNRAN